MLKREKLIKILGIGSLCLFLLGCTKESFLLQKENSSTVVLEEVIALEKATVKKDSANLEIVETTEENAVLKNRDTLQEEPDETIAVHICGAVNQPGVYYMKKKQRVHEGILKAGGFREDADRDYLNQALFLEDGMKVIVPTREETKELKMLGKQLQEEFIQEPQFDENTRNKQQKVDLNTADEALLCTLPGIGESRAKSILAYRKEHGGFQKPEDIMKVSGIKEAAYEKIKDYVTVSQ